jgi:hypothetical protein
MNFLVVAPEPLKPDESAVMPPTSHDPKSPALAVAMGLLLATKATHGATSTAKTTPAIHPTVHREERSVVRSRRPKNLCSKSPFWASEHAVPTPPAVG